MSSTTKETPMQKVDRAKNPKASLTSTGAEKVDALISRGVLTRADLYAWDQREFLRFAERYHQQQQERRQRRAA